MELTEDLACKFARIALGHVGQEYPNKLDHVLDNDADALSPRELHPAFFGSFDWHSCVHSWWMLLTIRRHYPSTPEAAQIDALAEATFSHDNLAKELSYLKRPSARGFERPYGWAWLLYLHQEAERHDDREWAARLEPLAKEFADRFTHYLPVLTYPITVGTHYNTAFALLLAREWAQNHQPALIEQIDAWSIAAFCEKTNYSGWEPSGDEFLSPVLIVAALMGQVWPREKFESWFEALVIQNGWLEKECHPVVVSDRSDGKIAHLDGLNLSRAWCLRSIDATLGESGNRAVIRERVESHVRAALPHIDGDYMGEHWLASFALLAMSAS